MTHKEWCEEQTGCMSPGCKPCRMCEKAYQAGLEAGRADQIRIDPKSKKKQHRKDKEK